MNDYLKPEHIDMPLTFQRWNHIAFIHWRYSPKTIQKLLPSYLSVDTFDRSAWVSLTPLHMNLRFPLLPWTSTFLETNLRTYVRDSQGRKGVWFFSLEAENLLAVIGARTLYHLQYFWADMKMSKKNNVIHYQSRRRWPHSKRAMTDITIKIESSLSEIEELEHFLTARWRLYSIFGKWHWSAMVEHAPWPLMKGEVLKIDQNLTEAAGIPKPEGNPLVHYSLGVDVRVGRPIPLS